jgi:uncharacterized protein (DUF2236 family)
MMESIRRDDYGFFGPDSPSWKVWASPTSLIGFQRAVVLEHFDPFLAAAVADSAGIYTDPTGRLDRTLAYFLTVAVADGPHRCFSVRRADANPRQGQGNRADHWNPL